MPITSGPTKERQIRVGIFFLMCAGMGAYFLYDGYVGYPGQNVREHIDQLDPDLQARAQGARVYSSVTPDRAEAVEIAVNKLDAKQQRGELESVFGGPPSFETAEAWWWFGPVHRCKVTIRNGRPTGRVDFQAAAKKEYDLLFQKIIGVVLCGLALVSLAWLVRIMLTRAVVDANGLKLRGRAPIPFESMTGLDDVQFRKKGFLDLLYTLNGQPSRVRLDEYHLGRFAEIVAAICERKGFRDPVAEERAEKAARAAGSA